MRSKEERRNEMAGGCDVTRCYCGPDERWCVTKQVHRKEKRLGWPVAQQQHPTQRLALPPHNHQTSSNQNSIKFTKLIKFIKNTDS